MVSWKADISYCGRSTWFVWRLNARLRWRSAWDGHVSNALSVIALHCWCFNKTNQSWFGDLLPFSIYLYCTNSNVFSRLFTAWQYTVKTKLVAIWSLNKSTFLYICSSWRLCIQESAQVLRGHRLVVCRWVKREMCVSCSSSACSSPAGTSLWSVNLFECQFPLHKPRNAGTQKWQDQVTRLCFTVSLLG